MTPCTNLASVPTTVVGALMLVPPPMNPTNTRSDERELKITQGALMGWRGELQSDNRYPGGEGGCLRAQRDDVLRGCDYAVGPRSG
jgi:hypothetical protein